MATAAVKKSSSASTNKSNSKKDGNDNDNTEKIQDSILARQRMLSAANVLDSWEALALWSCARGETIPQTRRRFEMMLLGRDEGGENREAISDRRSKKKKMKSRVREKSLERMDVDDDDEDMAEYKAEEEESSEREEEQDYNKEDGVHERGAGSAES